MDHKGNGDTSRGRSSWNSPKEQGKKTRETGDQKRNRDCEDPNSAEIC